MHRILGVLCASALVVIALPAVAEYRTCTRPSEVAANISEPVPEGRISNAAATSAGTALPEDGFLGSGAYPAPDDRGVYNDILWGNESWEEPSRDCITTYQIFDFQPAKDYNPKSADNKIFPTIVYFHPNGEIHKWETNSRIDKNVAQLAKSLNYHFISVEFRHPVADQYLQDDPPPNYIPHVDVGLFIQFLRRNAALMKVDARNIFAFGQSRGALALWQGLQVSMGTGAKSSAITGFVGYQAQTSYQCDRFAELYLTGPTVPAWLAECKSPNENRHDALFKNAIDAVAVGAPNIPVMLQYQDDFVLEPGTESTIRKITPEELAQRGDGIHYANFGMALYNRYRAVGAGARMDIPKKVPMWAQFSGWENFVNKWMVRP